MRFLTALDFETTGLYPNSGDRITEIGALKMADSHIIGYFQTLVNPEIPIPKTSSDITGITDEMVAGAPKISEVIHELISFIGNDILIIHNVPFDSEFLSIELEKVGLSKEFKFYDTLTVSRQRVKNAPAYRLGALKDFFRLETIGDLHRALSDCYVTLQLFLQLEGVFNNHCRNEIFRELNQLIKMRKEGELFVRF